MFNTEYSTWYYATVARGSVCQIASVGLQIHTPALSPCSLPGPVCSLCGLPAGCRQLGSPTRRSKRVRRMKSGYLFPRDHWTKVHLSARAKCVHFCLHSPRKPVHCLQVRLQSCNCPACFCQRDSRFLRAGTVRAFPSLGSWRPAQRAFKSCPHGETCFYLQSAGVKAAFWKD